ncbi:MAG TPA: chemotaxis protein CheW [Candidatus Angelobacter sp.]|nr:chemotaxis protein CheW [Candidatus Angelobacter sp.]
MSDGREKSYVLFPMGEKRFALPAEVVAELARPDHLQRFPHRTPMLAGVLVRRGRIVPVCDVAQILLGPDAPPRKFFLIANCQVGSSQEWTAIPVTGECELASLEPARVVEGAPAYVTGSVTAGAETVAVVDLEKLLAMETSQPNAPTPGASQSQLADTGQAGSPDPGTLETPR